MMRAWLVLAVAAATAAGQRSAPNVSNWDTHSTGPAWQTGTLNINWTKPADWSPSSYFVSVLPLDHTNTFDSNASLADFVLSPGRLNHSITVNPVLKQAVVSYTGSSWQSATLGRGYSPYAFRRMPEGGAMEIGNVSCPLRPAGAARWSCGMVAFNAGFNKPLFTWMVETEFATGKTYVILNTFTLSVNFSLAEGGRPWSQASGLSMRIEHNVADTVRPWIVRARMDPTLNWTLATASYSIPAASLDTGYHAGDTWYGFGARALGGAMASSALAYFDRLRISMPFPTGVLKDLYGNVDMCVATTSIVPVNMTVYGTNATIQGLSSNFPYMFYVYGVDDATGTMGNATADIEGTFFWARKMPPRQQRISAWWTPKYLPISGSTYVTYWPDGSGNQHHMRQPGTTLLRPYVYKYQPAWCSGTGTCPYDYISSIYAHFERSYGSFATTGADSIDLGVTGPMTMYIVARNQRYDVAIVAGKGYMSNNYDLTPNGYVVGQWGTPTEVATSNVWWGARIAPINAVLTPTAGYASSSVRSQYNSGLNTNGMYMNQMIVDYGDNATRNFYQGASPYMQRMLLPSDGTFGNFNLSACYDIYSSCTYQVQPTKFDLHANFSTRSFNAPVMSQWTPTPGNPDSMDPSGGGLVSALNFHIGGPNTPSGEPAYSWSGDLFDLIIYREAHTTPQKAAVMSWVLDQYERNMCKRDLTSAYINPSYNTQNCRSGSYNGYCYQYCPGGQVVYLNTNYHYCYDGSWDSPVVICRAQCPDMAPPIYLTSCTHRWLNETWNATANSDAINVFQVYPQMPEHVRAVVWQWDTVNQVVNASNKNVDKCNRLSNKYTHLALWYNYWSTYVNTGMLQVVQSDVMLMDNTSTAGITLRMYSEYYHYKAEISRNKVALYRNYGSLTSTLLAQVTTNITVTEMQWNTLKLTALVKKFEVYLNDRLLITVNEPTIYTPSYGGWGMYIGDNSAAKFDNFLVDTSCAADVTMSPAQYVFGGNQLIYTCRPGYTPLGNLTLTCKNNGQYDGSLVCLSKPPKPQDTPFSLDEFSRNGSFVGQVVAQAASPEQTITYSIASQWPPGINGTATFTISGCSGAIRVNDPGALDATVVNYYNLTIFAYPDTQTIAGVYWNVTVTLNILPTPPFLAPATYTANATYVGPIATSWVYTNRNKYPLRWSIFAGQPSPPLFAIDPLSGNMSILAPGMVWAPDRTSYDLYIKLEADGITADIALQSLAVVTIQIQDVNVPPMWMGIPAFYLMEATLGANMAVGMVSASDPNGANINAPANWYNVTYSMTKNADWKTFRNVFSLTPQGALTLVPNLGGTFDTLDYAWFDRLKVRTVLYVTVLACDSGVPRLCSNGTVAVAITPNTTTPFRMPFLDDVIVSSPVPTTGGSLITVIGQDFPPGGVMGVLYTNPVTGYAFMATGCYVSSTVLAECYTAPGYGRDLKLRVVMDGTDANFTTPFYISYDPPEIQNVTVMSAFSTGSGSSVDVRITGTNLYGPVSLAMGNSYEWNMLVKSGGNTSVSTSHTTVTAGLAVGCGANLPVRAIVGGQASINTGSGPWTISFPAPSLTSVTVPGGSTYNVSSLSTLGGQRLYVNGANLGPATVGGSAMMPTLRYRDSTGAFTHTVVCSKVAAAPHSQLDCTTEAGVGGGLAFSVDICSQPAPFVPLSNASYAPPRLISVTTPRSLSTEGGQSIQLTVAEVGPVNTITSIPQAVSWVRYGRPGAPSPYSAVNCYVSFASPSGSEITCLTAEGTGAGHQWQLNIAGQQSNSLPTNTTYTSPSIFYFTGRGAVDADTDGGAMWPVEIVGSNLGPDNSTLDVWYSTSLSVPRDIDGLLPTTPGEADGFIKFRPRYCTFTVPHRQLLCIMPPSAGDSLSWTVHVDGLMSTTPTTSFAAPSISSIWLNATTQELSSDGGQEIVVTGANFGLQYVVQSLRYGPSGNEYAATITSATSHTLRAITKPGIGSPLSFVVRVADQSSLVFRSNMTYASPRITGLSTTVIQTEAEAGRPQLLTITGYELGLLNPDVVVEVVWGNPADAAVVRLPVVDRTPSLTDVSSPQFNPGPSPVEQSVTVALPPGAGYKRAVRILQYLRGTQVRASDVSSLSLQGPESLTTVSYANPYIDYVLLYTLSLTEIANVVAPLFPSATPIELANARRMEIIGRNLGLSPSATVDTISRSIELQMSPGVWSSSQTAYFHSNWTSYKITAFVLPPAGTVRITLGSTSFNGSTQYVQSSNEYAYSDISAMVSALQGSSADFPTPGGPGNTITMQASGLAGTQWLNVTVGFSPFIVNCRLLALDGTTPINNYDEAVNMLKAQSGGVLAGTFMYTIKAEVPEGQGKDLPVLVWRNGAPSGVTTNGLNLISYTPPAYAATGIKDPVTGNFDMRPYPASLEVRPETAGATWVRVEGSNFGPCPSIALLYRAAAPTTLEGCLVATDGQGNSYKVPNPAVRTGHTFFEFQVPAGEGTGFAFSLVGWYFTLGAGDGLNRQDAGGRILVRYQAPVVASLSTDGPIDTAGGKRLLVTGRNLGYMAQPQVRLLSGTRALPCTNVVRYSHFNLSCVVSAGSGVGMTVEVTVDDLMGTGGSFSYSPPSVARMSLIPLASLTPAVLDQLRNGSLPQGAVSDSIFVSPAPDGTGPQLTTAVHGGDVLVLDGTSFSVYESGVNCIYAAWPPAWGGSMVLGSWPPSPYVTVGTPQCDSAETFLGEGEVFTNSSALFWNHTRVVFLMPPGSPGGTRMVTLQVGGQLPVLAQQYANVLYSQPWIQSTAVGRTPLSTDGGDLLDVWGAFGYAAVNALGNDTQRVIRFPVALPLTPGTTMPTEQVRVDLTATGAVVPCLASGFAATGAAAPGFTSCRMPALHSITIADPATNGLSADRLTVIAPPGVGVNKTLVVTYVAADGSVVSQSGAANYSYAPPAVTSLAPDLLYATPGAYSALYITAANVGRLRDVPYLSVEEQHVDVTVGGRECIDPQRVLKNQQDAIQCRLSYDDLPVGYQNVTVTVAGQTGILESEALRALLLGCGYGAFGHIGEQCKPCMRGAECKGFINEESVGVTDAYGAYFDFSMYSHVNVTEGPVMVGDVEVFRRGYHTYPKPLPGFFNLNGSMAEACPAAVRAHHTDRDVCIVGCVPAEACLANNFCSDPYTSKAPYYRCADCNSGFYRSNGDCIRCPQSPILTFIGFGVLILFVAGFGYFLNKYQFDIRLASIGIDAFQVLAVLAQSKVAWPPEIKRVFRVLAAFNLNIEVIAPECLIPDVGYIQRFFAILSLPFAVFIVFIVVNIGRFLFFRYVLRQKDWKTYIRSMAGSISIALMLIFLFYLQDCKMLLGIFECLPAEPDDGKKYLQVGTFEECGKHDGVQQRLIPWSIVGIVVLVAGYPLGTGIALYRLRGEVMEDQILLASRLPPKTGSAVAVVRAALSRTYYAYKPDCWYWSLCIIIRKFGIALSSLIFSRNSSFQLGMCLLIMLLAFGAHMRTQPYMGRDDYDDVLETVALKARSEPFWHQLRLRVLEVGDAQRKEGRKNGLKIKSVADATNFMFKSLLNYNVVEGILLFTVALVCLLGVLLEVARPQDDFYQSSRTSLTYNLLLLLAAGITYFTVVFFADLASQFITKRESNAFAGGGSSRKLDKKAKLAAQDKRSASGVNILKGASSTEIATSNNPMLVMSASRQGSDSFIKTITSMEEAPSKAAWAVFKDQLQTITAQLQEMSTEMTALKSENARLHQRLDTTEPSPSVSRPPRMRQEAQQRRQFEPRTAIATADGGSQPGSPSLSGTFAPFKRTLSTKRMSVSRMPISRMSSDGGDSDGEGVGSPKSVASPLAKLAGSYASPLSPLSLAALKAADSRSASARSVRRSKLAADTSAVLADDDEGATPPLSTDVSEMTSFQLDGTPMATATAAAPSDSVDAPAPATSSE